jgi:flagellar biosynthetic protein FliQ
MTPQLAIETIQQCLLTALSVALPLLVILFIVGIGVSLLQILTSIQDPSFGAVPRLTAFFVALMVALPWLVMKLMTYTERLFGDFTKYAH